MRLLRLSFSTLLSFRDQFNYILDFRLILKAFSNNPLYLCVFGCMCMCVERRTLVLFLRSGLPRQGLQLAWNLSIRMGPAETRNLQ